MSVGKTLDDLIGRLEKAQSGVPASEGPGDKLQGISKPDAFCPKCHQQMKDCVCVRKCGCLEKSADCGCKKGARLRKGKVQEQAFCKKCRGELGKCECLRKSGLDSLIDVLAKQVR